MDFEVECVAIEEMKRRLNDGTKKGRRALRKAINKSLPPIRRAIVEGTTDEYYAKKGAVTSSLKTERADVGTLEGVISSRSRPMPLAKFRVVPGPGSSRRPAGGLTAFVKRANGGGMIKHSFFVRKGMVPFIATRLPKAEATAAKQFRTFAGPSVSQMMAADEVKDDVARSAQAVFADYLADALGEEEI